MTVMSAIDAAKTDRFDALAAELADFCWETRQREQWLNEFESMDPELGMPDRIAILSEIEGRFDIRVALVDGDGLIHD